ncbi:MAG: S8 family peptidase, partial [Hyphomicrobiales bacterium]
GEDTGQPVSGSVVKLIDQAPAIPAADGEADPELVSVDNYAADAPGGEVNGNGEIAIALVDDQGDEATPLVTEVADETPASTNGGKNVVRQDVAVNQEKFEQLVIGALKAETDGSAGTEGEAEPQRLAMSLAPKGAQVCVSRMFRIGPQPFYVVKLPASAAETFKRNAAESGYSFVEPDPCRNKEEAANDPHFEGAGLWGQKFDNQWAIKRVGFSEDKPDSWPALDALKPVTVAVIDSGLDWYHPDLPSNVLWRNEKETPDNGIDDDGNGYADDVIGWNFIDYNRLPWDHDGHGTFVAGVIAAGQSNSRGIAGINPAARIMVLKALDAFGRGYASMVAEAIAYAADNGARVINLSLGGRGLTRIEQLAVDHARSKQALVVVAAGNAGKEVAGYSPAGLEGAITVTATDRRDRRAGFSNWGPLVDIAAPGVDVLSLRARKTDLLSLIPGVKYEKGKGIVGGDRAYFRASGTSFAAPIVSGTLSLILSLNPTLTPDEAKRMVLNSALDIETPGFDNYTGYGLLDVAAALKAAPDYFVESRISGVKVVKKAGKPVLRVLGTANADSFAKATLYLGKGAKPKKWLRVNVSIDKPVTNTGLMDLPASIFKGSKQWTIRLITEHGNGDKREARFNLTLG